MATTKKVRLARRLRQRETDLEHRLWQALRDRQSGFKIRRQHPIGPYVADFACPEAKLAIEIDGYWHEERTAQDQRRTEIIKTFGYDVVRYTIDEAAAIEATVEVIRFTIKERLRELKGRD
ncbi:MAG: DUF559 domain-containing protein [Alphaproteobacteria bacterium]|nr:DUF559 domain-containing protein [Alphaproteobacteria bacterium]